MQKRWVLHWLVAVCLLVACVGETAWATEAALPKYVFLFIGDGMGIAQATALGNYRGAMANDFRGTLASPTPENPPEADMPVFMDFPSIGLMTTYDASKFITDSASAGTAMASGVKTFDGVVGLDVSGNIVPSIAARLKDELGCSVAIISSVSLDHGTPAAFYAHTDYRKNYYDIATQLPASGFDFFGGGGFLSEGWESPGEMSVREAAESGGYQIVDTEANILALGPEDAPVIAIRPDLETNTAAFPYAIDGGDGLRLKDFVSKALDVMGEESGFFMMCEGGKIDWTAHNNDALTLIYEVAELEAAVEVALAFYEAHPEDTLIIVTGDHETGGMSIGSNLMAYDTSAQTLSKQTVSHAVLTDQIEGWRMNGTAFEEAMETVRAQFGLTEVNSAELARLQAAYAESMTFWADRTYDEVYREAYSYYSDYEPFALEVTRILNSRAGIGWTTTLHSGSPVPVYAIGNGAETFEGLIDNTDIYGNLVALCGLE